MPPTGLIVTSVSAPLDTDMKTTPKKIQVGESSSISILGLVAFGDASMEAAAMDGGLKTIEYADYNYFSILGIFHKFTVRAYGE
jgi:hypothetical protein